MVSIIWNSLWLSYYFHQLILGCILTAAFTKSNWLIRKAFEGKKKAVSISQYLDSRCFAKNGISTRSCIGTPTGSHSTKNFSTLLFCERKYFSFQVSAQFCPIRICLLKFIEFLWCRKRELAEISRGVRNNLFRPINKLLIILKRNILLVCFPIPAL